jgi:hypothetical protein
MKISYLSQIIFMLLLMSASTAAQAAELKLALPRVTSASVPLYPPLARVANMEGIIHTSVTTDGECVTSAYAKDGPKLLVAAVEDNARTWQFAGASTPEWAW